MATTFAVPDGRVAMAATLYTGNGSTNTISNIVNTVGLQPDLLWTKSRSAAYYHYLQDSVRGVNKALFSNATDAETAITTTTTTLNTTGFAFNGTESGLNANAATFVAWQWKAGGTAVSNTAGSITSSVSANTTAGFSVVTYTGTGANATVGHGLGIAPGMVIIKSRSVATNWIAYHSSVAATAHLVLNLTDAAYTDVAFNNTAPTSSVFSIGPTGYSVNNSAATYVAYCWAPVAGYSAFGSYTGNGSADGPFIYTGFRPRFILIKQFSGTPSAQSNCGWMLIDTSVNPYNFATNALMADSATAPWTYATGILDILSNGFKLRNAGFDNCNNSACSYIYAAFAENPLRYSNAR